MVEVKVAQNDIGRAREIHAERLGVPQHGIGMPSRVEEHAPAVDLHER